MNKRILVRLRQAARTTLAACGGICFILMSAQNPDGSINLGWSFQWLLALSVLTVPMSWLGMLKRKRKRQDKAQ